MPKPTGKSKKSIWNIKSDIYKWLQRLGVHEGDINIKSDNLNQAKAIVVYVFKGQDYNLSTTKRNTYTANLHSIELIIHSRVLGIERGIETLHQAFAGYKTIRYSNRQYFDDCNTVQEAKTKFKRLSKKFHPDTQGGSVEKFQELQKQLDDFERGRQ